MTTVFGNNITISATDIVGSTQGLIIRTPTTDSSDTLGTASSIILAYYGTNTSDYNENSFMLRIYNSSSKILSLGPGTGITMFPQPSDIILPQATHTYTIIKTSGSTMKCYMISNANAPNTTGISLANGNIVVGSTFGIGTEVSMSGDTTIVSSGIVTLSNTSVTPGVYKHADITVDSKGRLTSASNGAVNLNTFYASGPTSSIDITDSINYTTITSLGVPVFNSNIYSYTSGIVTILSSGEYEICYTVQFNSNGLSGTASGSFQSRILLNNIGIPESVTQTSMQRISGTNNTTHNTKSWIISASVNDTISIQYAELITTTVAQISANQTTFTIKQIQ